MTATAAAAATAASAAAPNHGERQPPETSVKEPTVFRGTEYSRLHSAIALFLLLGSIHLTVALSLTALLRFPSPLAIIILGLLLCCTVIPLDQKSEHGQKLAKYIYKHSCGYFPITLHVEDIQAFDPNQAYVLGFEPHGVFPVGALALSQHVGFLPLPKVKFLASSAAFQAPFLRQIWTWIGFIPATKQNFFACLGGGHSCVLIPGGIQEMVYMNHDSEVVFLRNRKGFVRVAMEMGRPLVPVFSFGQRNIFCWWKPSGKIFARFSRALKFAPILCGGVFGSPIPYQHPIHVFVGRPIELKKNAHPTVEEVDEVHKQFVAAIEEIFHKHKKNAGYPDLELKII